MGGSGAEFKFIKVTPRPVATIEEKVAALKQHLAPYTAEWAAKISGVPAEKIRSFALEFARTKPACVISYRGAVAHYKKTVKPEDLSAPGVIAISHHCGHWEYGRYASGNPALINAGGYERDTRLKWWTANGAHPNWIIANRPDPIGGQQCWMDTVVKVTKV